MVDVIPAAREETLSPWLTGADEASVTDWRPKLVYGA
jgi:hypothetical protein